MPPESKANVPDDRARYTHMLEMAQKATEFVKGRTRAHLDSEEMLALALMRCVEIVGEAAANISEEGCRRAPDIDWKVVTGMRHRLIHAYHQVNLDILWDTIQIDLPPLIESVQRVLREWDAR